MAGIPEHLKRRRSEELAARRARGEPTWEPLTGEPQRTYQWFLVFLQRRDFQRAAQELGVSVTALHAASSRWGWAERLRDFQRSLAQQLAEQSEYELSECLSMAVAYLKQTLANPDAPATARLRAAELALRYSSLGRTPTVRVEMSEPQDALASAMTEIQRLALERLRQQTPADANTGDSDDAAATAI